MAQKQTVKSSILLIVISASCAGIGGFGGTLWQGKQQLKLLKQSQRQQSELQKQSLATGFQCETAELFNEAEYVADQLAQKYGPSRVDKGDIPKEDLDKWNGVVKRLNTQLSSMFIIMPDSEYRSIVSGVPPGEGKLADFKDRLLCGMRKAQWPGTKYSTREDIRCYLYKHTEK